MPVITVAGPNTINKETKSKLVRDITEVVSKRYNMSENSINVLIQEYPSENVGVSGVLISEIMDKKAKSEK